MKNLLSTAICAGLICTAATFAVSTRADRNIELSLSPRAGDTSNDLGVESTLPTDEADTKAYSWYCKHRTDGCQPEAASEMSFIDNYGAFYIDKSHADSNSEDKVIYLTFDAGYENGNIEKILDTLSEKDVKGAFFILEHLIESNTDLVKRMADEGHTVCNHTANHKDMTETGDKAAFESELRELEKVYTALTGGRLAHYYRPPEGRFSEANLKWANELGYKTVLWSFAYADWDNGKQMSCDAALDKIISTVHNGEIMLLHPTSETNARILPELIDTLRAMGYRFGTLDELGEESHA